MTYTIDFIDGDVFRWSMTPDGVELERDTEYTPTIYAGGRDGDHDKPDELQGTLEREE